MIEDDDNEIGGEGEDWKTYAANLNNKCMIPSKSTPAKQELVKVSARAKEIIVRNRSGKLIYHETVTIQEFDELIRPLFESMVVSKETSTRIDYSAH